MRRQCPDSVALRVFEMRDTRHSLMATTLATAHLKLYDFVLAGFSVGEEKLVRYVGQYGRRG